MEQLHVKECSFSNFELAGGVQEDLLLSRIALLVDTESVRGSAADAPESEPHTFQAAPLRAESYHHARRRRAALGFPGPLESTREAQAAIRGTQ